MIYTKTLKVPRDVEPVSLQDLIHEQQKPSLNERVALAHALARCLMYLPAVNWLHKCVRSNNIVYFTPPGSAPQDAFPISCGYEYARSDIWDEPKEETSGRPENGIYRHPSVLDRTDPEARSKKSHDTYSLGIVLMEIAQWKPIDQTVNCLRDSNSSRNREKLLSKDSLTIIERNAGEAYAEVVRKCLTEGGDLGLYDGPDGTDTDVGAEMQRIFARDLVDRLSVIRL